MQKQFKRLSVLLVLLLALGVFTQAKGLLFQDNFDRIMIGPDWTIVDDPYPSNPSRWTISNGRLMETSNIYRTNREYDFWQGTHIVAGSSEWTDYELSSEISSQDDDGFGAILRYVDKENYYRFIMVDDPTNGGPFRRLEKFVKGERILLDEAKEGYESAHPYKLQFLAYGDKLEVWLDGQKILEAKDNTFSSGKIGFMSYATDSLAIRSVKVRKTTGEPSDLSEINEPFAQNTLKVFDPTATTIKVTWSGDASEVKFSLYKRDEEDKKTPIVFSNEALIEGRSTLVNLEPYTDYYLEAVDGEEIVSRRFRTRKLQITRGPYLSMATPTSVTVAFGALDAYKAKVHYWLEAQEDQKKTLEIEPREIKDGYQYAIELTGLKPQTRYSYQVEMGTTKSEVYTFVSAPDSKEAQFTFNVYGDTQNGRRHKEVITAMNQQEEVAFLLHQGDIVNTPVQSEYNSFFKNAQPFIGRVPFYPVRGNHDGQHYSFNDYFELPGIEDYYSFVYGSVYVLAINSPAPFGPNTKQYEWIKQDLEAHKDMPWKVAFTHYSAYSPTEADNDMNIRQYLSPLFEEYGVNIVFSGHSHVYDHYFVNNVHYVLTGGGGGWEITHETSKFNAPFNYVKVHVSPEKLVVEGLKPTGELIETFEITK